MRQTDRPEGLGTLFSTFAALASPAHTVLTSESLYQPVPKLQVRPSAIDLWRAVVDTVLTWQERSRQRQILGRLDDHLLRDMGITRADAEAEAHKPFWRI